MAYVRVPRPGRHAGYAGYSDLPSFDPNAPPPSVATYQAQAQAAVADAANQVKAQATAAATSLADQSKQQAIAFAEQQLQNYPSAAAVEGEYNKYKSYLEAIPNFDPRDLQDPAKCVALMKTALIAYAKANGYPTTTKEAEQELAAYALSIASSEFGVDIPPHWPSNMKDLKSVAVDLACTAVIMATDVDPRSLTVVYDALLDGKLSPAECEAIGATAGAIAGAVIGQAFGIPAPIGAFIGGLIGKDIGGTLGQIFGAGPSGAAEMQGRIDAAKTWANAQLAKANQLCSDSRSAYWNTFDELLLATEVQWELAEQHIGWRFNLRWFGTEISNPSGSPFSQAWDPVQKYFTGPVTYANRADPIRQRSMATYTGAYDQQGKEIIKHSIETTYACSYGSGCPYPVVTDLPMPAGLERDAQAFLARGARWVPPADRHYQCSYPPPQLIELFDGNAKARWLEAMQLDLQREAAAIRALQILSVTVIGDLIKTASAVAAEKTINDILRKNKVELNASALARGKALSQAQSTGKNLSDLLNYGTLALGAGLLAAAIFKREQ